MGHTLLPASLFSLAAASAGLCPTANMLTYPENSSLTRLVLQNLRPDVARVRLATMEDLDDLERLEVHWGAAELQAVIPSLWFNYKLSGTR